mgnify:CR=1 FL=1
MDKKYIGATLALNQEQASLLQTVKEDMEKNLCVKLSRASIVERLLNLYIKKEKKKYPFNYGIKPYHIFLQGREKGVNFTTLIKLVCKFLNCGLSSFLYH